MKRGLSIDETTTKEMARQARSPAINNAVKTEDALASTIGEGKKNTHTHVHEHRGN